MRISDWSSDVCSSDLAGAGIAAVERFGAAVQAIDTDAVHHPATAAIGFNANAQSGEYRSGGAGVFAFEKAIHPRLAIGQTGEHDRAMRYRLVARHRNLSTQGPAGTGAPIQRSHRLPSRIMIASIAARRRALSLAVPRLIRRPSASPYPAIARRTIPLSSHLATIPPLSPPHPN